MKKNKEFSIFFVTTMFIEDGKKEHERTPGFFLTHKEAEKCVTKNFGDIYETGYYNYVVIEEFHPGLYSYGKLLQWYKANYNSKTGVYKVKKVTPPKEWQNICGFAIG